MAELTFKALALQWVQSKINPDIRKLVIKCILFAGIALIATPIISYSGATTYANAGVTASLKWDNNTDYWMVGVGVSLVLLSAYLTHVFFPSVKSSKVKDLSKLQKLLDKNRSGKFNLEIQQRFKDLFKFKWNTPVDEISFLCTRNGALDAIGDYKFSNEIIKFESGAYRPKPNSWDFEKVIGVVTKSYVALGVVALAVLVAPLFMGLVGKPESGVYTAVGLLIGLVDILLIPTLRKYSCAKRMIELD